MSTALYGGIINLNSGTQPVIPSLVLATRAGKKQGVIENVTSLVITNYLNEASEISFDVHKETEGIKCSLWNKIKDFKLIYIPQLDTPNFNPWYELAVTVDEEDETVKNCEAVHLQESELSQLTLDGVEINTEDDIARDDYKVATIYNADDADASLLDRILNDKASHYKIQHVDSSIAKLQRTFSWDGDTIKDAFDEIAEEVECLFVYGEANTADGKIHRTISVYDLNDICKDCGKRGNFADGKCTECGSENIISGYGTDSGVFISTENFAENILYSTNKDDVKNCFRLVAGDDLMTATVRNINPSGSQYIWYLSDEAKADMSEELRAKLASYDELYEEYSKTKTMSIYSGFVDDYNTLVDRYSYYDKTLTKAEYPVVGYSALTDLYYGALNLQSIVQTTLAPASATGTTTTAKEQIAKLTQSALSPVGILSASTASTTTVTSSVKNAAKVYVDTSLYSVDATCSSYAKSGSKYIWKGTITLESYTDEEDTATTATLSLTISDATTDYLKTQIEKAMKKNDIDATSTVDLFSKSDSDFKSYLQYYSADNLEILSNIARGCLDILIEQGCGEKTHDLHKSMYVPYYNKCKWIEEKLESRESEVAILTNILNRISKVRNTIQSKLDLRTYLGDDLWVEFCSFRRDDEYQNDNFISDGLTDSEIIAQAKEFMSRAQNEIIKAATPQHTVDCSLSNLLLYNKLSEALSKETSVLSPLLENFDVGNWLRLEVDDSVFKLRLIEYTIDFDNLVSIDVGFSDVTRAIGFMSDTKSVLSQAKSMATSYSYTQRQANKGSSANTVIVDMIDNGIDLTNQKIINSINEQKLVIDETGMLMRGKDDNSEMYSDEQVKIINHGFYFTNDAWQTVKTALGRFTYFDPETGEYVQDYGLIANKIVGNIIIGSDLSIFNEAGSVKIDENGLTLTASHDLGDNSSLFTVQKDNGDGTYDKYIYVDADGDLKIDAKNIQISATEGLDVYVEEINQSIGNLKTKNAEIEGTLSAQNGRIGTLETDNIKINDTLETNTANINTLTAKTATVEETLNATNINVGKLQAENVTITKKLEANDVSIKNLQTEKLDAETAKITYANIDFSNIGQAAMEYFYSKSGLIENVVVGEATITGDLVGVTISGDLIKGNTIVAEKLVIKGTDGLYYKLNTDGMTTEAEQTDENSLNGSLIQAKTITASKITVDDLVAFGATIGGYNIKDHALYSGVKSSPTNTTRGVYMDDDGQFAVGDASNYLRFFKDTDGTYKLEISAASMSMSSTGKTVEETITDIQKDIDDVRDEVTTMLYIDSSKGNVFKNDQFSTVLSVILYHGNKRITTSAEMKEVFGSSAKLQWSWQDIDDDAFGIMDPTDSRFSDDGFKLTLSAGDVDVKVTFMCELII